jgi:dephospho-CoA kinase
MDAKQKIIAIVGMPASGKSDTAKIFSGHGYPVIRFGEITDTEVKERGLPLVESSEREVRESLRERLGMAAYAIKSEPKIKKALENSTVVVIDGLYSWEEYSYLKKRFPDLILLVIYARPALRYQRIETRKIRPLTQKIARERDIAELLNLNKGMPIAIADYLIENNSDREELKEKVDKFIDEIV